MIRTFALTRVSFWILSVQLTRFDGNPRNFSAFMEHAIYRCVDEFSLRVSLVFGYFLPFFFLVTTDLVFLF